MTEEKSNLVASSGSIAWLKYDGLEPLVPCASNAIVSPGAAPHFVTQSGLFVLVPHQTAQVHADDAFGSILNDTIGNPPKSAGVYAGFAAI